MKSAQEVYYIGNTVIEVSGRYSEETKPEELDAIMERIALLAKLRGMKETRKIT